MTPREIDKAEHVGVSGIRRAYVLGLFTLIYTLNFIDRQIVTILAPYLKADLNITDAQVGLLFGTAFALFYALFGLPLARLADGWNRVTTLSLGLMFWSAMTTVSGLASHFVQLAAARVGVGIGEASASPAAISVLQDYFPKERRATALAIYQSGIYVGAGASLVLGGWIIAWWSQTFESTPPFGLTGWQATYIIVGAPGIFLGLLVWLTVPEPVRGAIDGSPHAGDPQPFRAAFQSLGTLVPPFSLFALARLGGRRAVLNNVAFLLLTILVAFTLIHITDGLLAPAKRVPIAHVSDVEITSNTIQWCALAIGLYATRSWSATLRLSDPVAARLTLGTPSFIALVFASGLISLSSYGLSAFVFLFATQYFAAGPQAGLTIGTLFAVCGGLGTIIGGIVADWARRRHPAGRLFLASGAVALATITAFLQYISTDWTPFLIYHGVTSFFLTMWLGAVYASCQDQVLPRMRGLAVAVQFLSVTLIGLGLGPYWVGLISDVTGSLRLGILSVLVVAPLAVMLLVFAARRLPEAERSAIARAQM